MPFPVQLVVQKNYLTMVKTHTNVLHIGGHVANGYSDDLLTNQASAAVSAAYQEPIVQFSSVGESGADASEDDSTEE